MDGSKAYAKAVAMQDEGYTHAEIAAELKKGGYKKINGKPPVAGDIWYLLNKSKHANGETAGKKTKQSQPQESVIETTGSDADNVLSAVYSIVHLEFLQDENKIESIRNLVDGYMDANE